MNIMLFINYHINSKFNLSMIYAISDNLDTSIYIGFLYKR